MRIDVNGLRDFAGQPLLCVTHSDRPTEIELCHLNHLETRYADPNRLPPREPFDSLLPLSSHHTHGGSVSVYHLASMEPFDPVLVCRFRPDDKPQHCIWHRGCLWVAAIGFVEILDADLRSIGRICDPWLSGGHTIHPAGGDRLLVSCSASDSVVVISAEERRVVDALRVPESLYGRNYDLKRTDSVIDHYITNELQIAHVNCASPWRDGILTSSLIPGALGWFSPTGEYRELVRGFVGCHGARVCADREELYFCDSCTGTVVFLDSDLTIRSRVSADSIWLHDALQIDGDWFALSHYERKAVELWDVRAHRRAGSIDCASAGAPQFLSWGC